MAAGAHVYNGTTMLTVNEIFYSIQGESTRAGIPCVFVRLTPHDEVKFVIRDRQDYDYACGVIARSNLATRAGAVLMSPVHGLLEPKTLSGWILEDRTPARLQLQLHKYIWTPETRGV